MAPETTPPRLPDDESDDGFGPATATVANDEDNDDATPAVTARAEAHARGIAATATLAPLETSVPRPPADDTTSADVGTDDGAPLFWTTSSPTRLHQRTVSSVSYQSLSHLRPTAINLEDRSSEDAHETARSCWAQSVRVNEYVVVSGATGIGAYVVWHCTVQTLQGGDLYVRKRYSEFDQLRANLVRAFPHAEAMIPQLPRKSIVSRFRPKFLEQRRAGLSHFLNCILLNPEFAASPILKDFIFS